MKLLKFINKICQIKAKTFIMFGRNYSLIKFTENKLLQLGICFTSTLNSANFI